MVTIPYQPQIMSFAPLTRVIRPIQAYHGKGVNPALFCTSLPPNIGRATMRDDWKKNIEDLDPLQAKFYQDEQLIIVDNNDQVVGPMSKGESHAMATIRKNVLHRALSLFLFDKSDRFLLTQRSSTKITFPDCFTNACCSHPLFNTQELEDNDGDAIGVRRATIRRASFELGIDESEIGPNDLKLMNRFAYQAESEGSLWGEAEIDYVFVLHKDIRLKPNPDEIKSIKYVGKDEMRSLLSNHGRLGVKLTPWIKLIANDYLFRYWDNLHRLDEISEPHKIVRFEGVMPASFTK